MAADLSYQPLVYHKQGSTELIVASSGLITVESGGEITIESGGTIDLESGGGIDIESGADITVEGGGNIAVGSSGKITVSTGGHIVFPVTGATSSSVGSTTLSTLPPTGLSLIESSGGGAETVRMIYLAAPKAGDSKYLVFTDASTTWLCYIDTQTAGATIIQSTGTGSTMGLIIHEGTTNDGPPAFIHLVAMSSAKWVALEMHPATAFTFASTSS